MPSRAGDADVRSVFVVILYSLFVVIIGRLYIVDVNHT